MELPTQVCVILVPSHFEPLGCFKDPPIVYLFTALFVAMDYTAVLTPSTKGEASVDRSVAVNPLYVSDYEHMPCLEMSARFRVPIARYRRKHYPAG